MEIIEQEDVNLPFARLFNTASAKILDFLLTSEILEYTKEEISELTRIPSRTLERSLQLLLHEEIITRRKKNRVYYYAINLSSLRVNGLRDYMDATLLFNLKSIKNKAK